MFASLLVVLLSAAVARATDDPTLVCADPSTIGGAGWTSRTFSDNDNYIVLGQLGDLHGPLYVGIESSVVVVSRGTVRIVYHQQNDATGGKGITGGPGTCFNASGRGLTIPYDHNIEVYMFCYNATGCDVFYSPVVFKSFCLVSDDCDVGSVCTSDRTCCNPRTLCDTYECVSTLPWDGCNSYCDVKACASGDTCGTDNKCPSSSTSVLDRPAMVGVIVASVVVFAIVMAGAFVWRMRKRQQEHIASIQVPSVQTF